LLNSIVGGQITAGVDSVGKINELARIGNAIQLTAAGGTPTPALTATDLALIGIESVTPDNLGAVLAAMALKSDDGSQTNSLTSLFERNGPKRHSDTP
jgi:hypothetical protein